MVDGYLRGFRLGSDEKEGESLSDQWLTWIKQIQALAQSGLHFSKDVYDRERYETLRALSYEMMAAYAHTEIGHIKNLFVNEVGYQTPKVDVRAVVFQENKLLMVRETHDGCWALPGGFCDVGLSVAENAVKEVGEESGYETAPGKLLALLDMNKHHHPPQPFHYYKIFIQCHLIGGEAVKGIETSDIGFFTEDQLPPLSYRRNTTAQLAMLFEFLRDRHKEVIVD